MSAPAKKKVYDAADNGKGCYLAAIEAKRLRGDDYYLKPKAVRIELPFPPSNHDVFKKHKGAYLSERYRKWRDAAGWLLKAQKPASMDGKVCVLIELLAPDRRRRDADNYTKGPIDLLVAHDIIPTDDWRTVREVTARWVDAGLPCVVTVRQA